MESISGVRGNLSGVGLGDEQVKHRVYMYKDLGQDYLTSTLSGIFRDQTFQQPLIMVSFPLD